MHLWTRFPPWYVFICREEDIERIFHSRSILSLSEISVSCICHGSKKIEVKRCFTIKTCTMLCFCDFGNCIIEQTLWFLLGLFYHILLNISTYLFFVALTTSGRCTRKIELKLWMTEEVEVELVLLPLCPLMYTIKTSILSIKSFAAVCNTLLIQKKSLPIEKRSKIESLDHLPSSLHPLKLLEFNFSNIKLCISCLK